MKKVFWSALMALSVSFILRAQELPKIMLPPPTAFELTKFGEFPVGLNTGTPSINIPITIYSTKNIQVPINLSYSSNGIKVDQLSSNVGLGWSLNAGGVISRIVRGKEDENYRLTKPIREINRIDVQGIEDLDPQSSFHETSDVNPDIVSFLHEASTDLFDSESDLFSYNFGSYSGKIVIDNEGHYRTIPHSNIKIEGNDYGFKLTTEKGISYYFYDKEISYSRTSCDNSAPLPPEQGYTSSWYLSKIEHSSGDAINFVYDTNDVEESYLSSITQTLEVASSYPITSKSDVFPSIIGNGVVTCENHSRVYRKRLIEINSTNPIIGRVLIDNSLQHHSPDVINYRLVKGVRVLNKTDEIISQADFSYHYTTNNRIFLKDVTFKNPSNKYVFQYNDLNTVPKRFSYSQDFWGYFNGKNNELLLPNLEKAYPVFNRVTGRLGNRDLDNSFSKKGLLTKIIYPSKGSTVFEYESNDYYGLETKSVYEYKSVSMRGSGSQFSTFSLGDYHQNSYEVNINYNVSNYENSSEGCYEYPADKATADVKIFDISNETAVLIYQKSFTSTTSSHDFTESLSLNKNKTYKLEVSSFLKSGNCIEANVSLRIKKDISEYKNILTGGNRIKNIKNYDSDNTLVNTKHYYYSGMNDIEKSSGDAVQKGLGHVSSRVQYHSNEGVAPSIISQGYQRLSSTGSFPITNSGSNNIYYRKVTVSHGGDNFEGGGEEHEFIVNRDGPGEQLLGPQRTISNFTNFGWNNGLEKKIRFFKKPETNDAPKIVIKELINNYKLDRTISEISNYNISEDYNIVNTQPAYPTYKCKAEDLNRRIPVKQCITNHTHAIGGPGWFDSLTYYSPDPDTGYGPLTLGNIECRSNNIFSGSSNNIIVRYINGACYGKIEGEEVSFPEIVQNLNVVKYKTNSYWYYLEQTIEKQYDDSGTNPMTTSTNYYYNNIRHLQQTKVETTNSKGELLKSETKYAHDVNDTILINQHRIAEPIESSAYKDNNLLSRNKTIYSTNHNSANLYLPEVIQTSKANQPLEDRIVYHSYDAKGNPTEVSKADGTHIVYIWGYHDTQPIAKIENAALADIPSSIKEEIIANSNLDIDANSETTLKNSLNKLRNTPNLSNAQITTYTYDPLIGVTSITDPRGETITYHYDNFNRLESVKDSQGNILKEHKYNYKNQ